MKVPFVLPQVSIGSQTFSLIVDTGSSNTWVGADKVYVKTSTSEATGVEVVSMPAAPVTVSF